ncbi:MAG: GPW/gp25 family protein [Catenulispora sp.]|nr:GPW/gp25 family protein [Catenulispora sp.]
MNGSSSTDSTGTGYGTGIGAAVGTDPTDALIGRGWSYPAAVAADGTISLVGGTDDLERSIELILTTAPGERPMRPEFGCGAHALVFAAADAATAGRLADAVQQALDRWEPRIVVDYVDVTADELTPGLLYIDVQYTVRATNSPRNLVFPFYTLPGEPTSAPGEGAP